MVTNYRLMVDTDANRAAALVDSTLDGILQPGQRVAIDGYHVEATGRRQAKALQIALRRQQQAALLGRRHAVGSAAVPRIGAGADLDKDDGLALAHDEVDFTDLAQEILLHQYQAVPLQVRQRPRLAVRAVRLSDTTWKSFMQRMRGCSAQRPSTTGATAPAA